MEGSAETSAVLPKAMVLGDTTERMVAPGTTGELGFGVVLPSAAVPVPPLS